VGKEYSNPCTMVLSGRQTLNGLGVDNANNNNMDNTYHENHSDLACNSNVLDITYGEASH
jgi:hypothetical protein